MASSHDAHETDGGHGSTPAAWTAVIVITIAFIVGTLALIIGNWPLFWVGVVLVLVGGVLGKVLQRKTSAQGSSSA